MAPFFWHFIAAFVSKLPTFIFTSGGGNPE
jgi:hypothetical protein